MCDLLTADLLEQPSLLQKKPQRATGPIESLGLLSTKCHRSRQPCQENLDEKGPQNIQPMPEVLEMQKKRQELAEMLNSQI